MPRYDVSRDEFVRSIDNRIRWGHRLARVKRLSPFATKSRQATIYDTAFRSDHEAVSYFYARHNDHMPDFDAPELLNEKIRWQFLHHPNPLMSLAADKIAVRDYLRLRGARLEAPALHATGTRPEALLEVDLPERFVLKSSHASGHVEIFDGSRTVDRAEMIRLVREWFDWDHWRRCGELHYRPLQKRWLIEEYIPALRRRHEYKISCYMGEPMDIDVNTDFEASCEGTFAAFDTDWNRLHSGVKGYTVDPRPFERPAELDFMLAEARRLSADFLHVRVDFLAFDDRLLFSELTFADLGAMHPYEPFEVNRTQGALILLEEAPRLLARGREAAAQLGWSDAAGAVVAPARPETEAGLPRPIGGIAQAWRT